MPMAAAAATAAPATIDGHGLFSEDHSSFSAESPYLCPDGTTTDLVRFVGHGREVLIKDVKTFNCTDGSGTFTLKINARVRDCDSTDNFTWVVAGGTGDYARLRGAGTGVGTYFPPSACEAEGIDDHLTGTLVLP